MSSYRVTLVRSFAVTIQADNPEDAKRLAEFYVGYSDNSEPWDRQRFGFLIDDIDMTQNDSIEAQGLEEFEM